jgi:DNA polymerase (family 10)
VRDLDSLAAALEAGTVAATKGLGPNLAAKLEAGIAALARRSGRHRLGDAMPIARDLRDRLAAALRTDARVEVTGSLRRWEESVGDIDLLAAGTADAIVTALAAIDDLQDVVVHDATMIGAKHRLGFGLHVHTTDQRTFGSRWIETSSPQAHLERLGGLSADAVDEAAIYAAAGFPWIAPEFRHLVDAYDIARATGFADIVAIGDIAGEVHSHTVWSDGLGTVEEMALAARARGYRYLGISDHSHSLGVANGLDAARLVAQGAEIRAVAARLDFPLLRASEVEVLKDGRLDFEDDVLHDLDLVVASTHTGLKRPRPELMARLATALGGGRVDLLAHPSGRLIEEREPGDFDWPEVYALARREGVALEINADPARLDLKPEHARAAIEAGCLLAINCDAHQPAGFASLEYGVMTARRGLVPRSRVLNAWEHADLVAWLARDATGRAPAR